MIQPAVAFFLTSSLRELIENPHPCPCTQPHSRALADAGLATTLTTARSSPVVDQSHPQTLQEKAGQQPHHKEEEEEEEEEEEN